VARRVTGTAARQRAQTQPSGYRRGRRDHVRSRGRARGPPPARFARRHPTGPASRSSLRALRHLPGHCRAWLRGL